MKSFKNKVVVITGAGSGMGRSYALQFAKLGSRLALNDFDEVGLQETLQLVKAKYDTDVFSKVFDVSDPDAMEQFASESKLALGNAHVVINNAGMGSKGEPVWIKSSDSIKRIMDINFYGVVFGTKAFLPQLIENREGAVVNISSVFGLVGCPGTADYSASKFAVRGFSESLMVELMDSPISVHLVHPGGIDTNIAKHVESSKRFESKFLTTAPDDMVQKVIQGIQKGKYRIVYGNQSLKLWLISIFLPLGLKSKLIHMGMKALFDPASYAMVKRVRK